MTTIRTAGLSNEELQFTQIYCHNKEILSLLTSLRIWQKTISHIKVKHSCMKVKVKWSRYRPGTAQRVGRGIALLFHDRGTRRGEWSAARPGRTLPPGKTRYSFYRRLGGPQGRSGRVENLVPTGIRSRTVQTVAQSLYRLSYPAHKHSCIFAYN